MKLKIRSCCGCLVKLGILLLLILLVLNLKNIAGIFYPLSYEQYISESAAGNELNPLLVAAVIKTESNFKADSQSTQGAVGLMQLMPDTAEWIAEKNGMTDYSVDMLSDPQTNIELGCWYLGHLHEKYDGDYCQLIAAYNAGPGNVDSWLSEGTWSGNAADLEQIPFAETRKYVEKVTFRYNIYNWIYGDS